MKPYRNTCLRFLAGVMIIWVWVLETESKYYGEVGCHWGIRVRRHVTNCARNIWPHRKRHDAMTPRRYEIATNYDEIRYLYYGKATKYDTWLIFYVSSLNIFWVSDWLTPKIRTQLDLWEKIASLGEQKQNSWFQASGTCPWESGRVTCGGQPPNQSISLRLRRFWKIDLIRPTCTGVRPSFDWTSQNKKYKGGGVACCTFKYSVYSREMIFRFCEVAVFVLSPTRTIWAMTKRIHDENRLFEDTIHPRRIIRNSPHRVRLSNFLWIFGNSESWTWTVFGLNLDTLEV